MEGKTRELYNKLTDLERKILQGSFDADMEFKTHKTDIERLREIVEELKDRERETSERSYSNFDLTTQNLSATSDRLNELSNQIYNLEKRMETLEEHRSSTDKRVWTVIEKILIGLIGGAITYLFSGLG